MLLLFSLIALYDVFASAYSFVTVIRHLLFSLIALYDVFASAYSFVTVICHLHNYVSLTT